MTLRALEIVESCLNFFAGDAKNARRCKYSASLAFASPLRSRYSEFLTLSILLVKNSLPLTVFTQLQRREASRLE